MMLIADTVAANDNINPMPVAARHPAVIELRDLKAKDRKWGGRVIEGERAMGHHADIIPGESIRLFGIERNRYAYDANGRAYVPADGIPYEHTFRVGDTAVYGGFNLTYTGTITAIGAKSVTISHGHGDRVTRMDIRQFSNWNKDFDLDEIRKRNSEWYD